MFLDIQNYCQFGTQTIPYHSDWIPDNHSIKLPARVGPNGGLQYERYSRPFIVCLCGSTRFKDLFIEMNRNLTLEGFIVLSVGFFEHQERAMEESPQVKAKADERKAQLDQLHFEKIRLADFIYVLNEDGYVGQSTRNEVNFAKSMGKAIVWHCPEKIPDDLKE